MKTLFKTALIFSMLGSAAAQAADSATQILDRHVAAMKKGDLETVMADYDDNALVIAPHGIAPGQQAALANDVFSGKANARKLFSVLTDKDHVGGNRTMTTRYESRDGDVTLMYWQQNKGTPQEVSGVDVFVIRGGKIMVQNVAIDTAKH